MLRSAYGFTYDALNRLKESVYGENPGSGFTANLNGFNESGITYDKNGNLLTLKRYSAGVMVDNLSYSYENSGVSNRLQGVSDLTGNSLGFTDVAGVDYSYDQSGNATKDLNKGITGISYNVLNLPLTVTKDASNSLVYVYSASGEKLALSTKVAGTVTTRYYAGMFEYDNVKALSLLKMGEGIVTKSSGGYTYEYYLKDHLGNTRVSFTPSGQVPVLAQRTDYYPFGLVSGQFQASTGNKYLYNGKELQSGLNWNVYDYGARFYDPQIGRWHTADVLGESRYEESPYCYVGNNPALRIDPDGRIWDTVLDAAFTLYDVGEATYQYATTGSVSATTKAALAADALAIVIPGVTGAGIGVRMAAHADDAVRTVDKAVDAVKAIDKVVDGEKTADKAVDGAKVADGIIYKRTNPKTGKEYIGQAKSEDHFVKRQASHDKANGVKHDYEVVDRGKPGVDLNVKEETHIRKNGGPNNNSTNGKLENKRHQMNDERYKNAGGTEVKNY